MKIEEIKTIVKLMAENDLTEFKIEAEEYNLCIKRGSEKVQMVQAAPVTQMIPTPAAQIAAPPATSSAAPAPTAPAAPSAEQIITSPLVGTFYNAPSQDAAPFVKVGDTVTADTVVCIVEAMKVMNEIKAEKSGVIKEVLVPNANPVEFGQPLFVIE
ncbi:MAG: acetyl-CoA carboxylase biotin carboxyl carrier protein [Lentisphaeria bacterium]|nr:acetyl-CoA carboxylase biotin carboxyl carrier protein [Lentisphaeria bacterium]